MAASFPIRWNPEEGNYFPNSQVQISLLREKLMAALKRPVFFLHVL
jgi:hypothetical protein